MRAIGGRAVAPARETTLESDLASAHAIIHILVTRDCGGEAQISNDELREARGAWITTRLAGDGITVRAR